MNWFVYFWLGCSFMVLSQVIWELYINDCIETITLGNALMILMLIVMGPVGILITTAIYIMLNEDRVVWQRKTKKD